MWLFVLLCLILLIVLLLMLRISLNISYTNELTVFVRILFFKLPLFPKRQKIKLKRFSAKGIAQKLKKDRIRQQKAADKQSKKSSEEKRENSISEMIEAIKVAYDILLAIKDRFFRYLHIHVAKLHLTVASEDAAQTAIAYGVAVQTVQYLVVLLESFTNVKYKDNKSVLVHCDFCQNKPTLILEITASLRLWQIIAVLLGAVLSYIKNIRTKEIEHKTVTEETLWQKAN